LPKYDGLGEMNLNNTRKVTFSSVFSLSSAGLMWSIYSDVFFPLSTAGLMWSIYSKLMFFVFLVLV